MTASSIVKLYRKLWTLSDCAELETIPQAEVSDYWTAVYAGPRPLLVAALDELIHFKPAPSDSPLDQYTFQMLIDRCWGFLNSPTLVESFRDWKEIDWDQGVDPVTFTRSLSLLRSHFSAGVAAYWAIQVLRNRTGAWEQVCEWLARATGFGLPAEAELGRPALENIKRGLDEADIVKQAMERLVPGGSQAARADGLQRVAYWLNGQRRAVPKRWRRIPIVAVTGESGRRNGLPPAVIGDLVLELVGSQETGLLESPTLWNRPLSDLFARTIQDAYEGAWPDPAQRPGVRWSVEFRGQYPLTPLEGASHGLAAHVGCHVLRDNKLYDREWVFSAQVSSGRVRTVEGLRDKWSALSPSDGYQWFGYSAEARDFSEAERRNSVHGRACLRPIGEQDPSHGVDEAIILATQTDAGVRAFLQAVTDYPDVGKRPHYLPRKPSELFISPDVFDRPLQDELEHRRRRKEKAQGAEKHLRQATTLLTAADRDVNEQDFDDDDEPPRRRSWEDVTQELRRTEAARGVLLGPPGQGKSFLAEMTASRLAAEALDCLNDRDDPGSIDEVPLPLVVSLPQMLKLPRSSTQSDLDHASQAILGALIAKFGSPAQQAQEYLRLRVTDPRTWLFLDGLDEVDQAATALQSTFQFARSLPGIVLLSGRPYGLTDHAETLRADLFGIDAITSNIPESVKAYRLAPFGHDQVQTYTGIWFRLPEHIPPHFDQLLRINPSIRHLARTPFLLSLLCAVTSDSEVCIDHNTTREGLYNCFFRMLFRIKKKNRWLDWEQFLPTIAIRMIGRAPDAVRTPHIQGEGELRHWLLTPADKNWKRPNPLERMARESDLHWVECLADELQDRDPHDKMRLLVSDSAGHLIFRHRSFTEFLAGKFLAMVSNNNDGEGWEQPMPTWVGDWLGKRANSQKTTPKCIVDKLSWRDDWSEVIKFAAGALAQPGCLLALLTALDADDLFGQRLGLAAECLPEIAPDKRRCLSETIDTITSRTLHLREELAARDSEPRYQRLDRAIGALISSGLKETRPLDQWLAGAVVLGSDSAWRILRWAGGGAARPVLITTLVDSLRGGDENARRAVGVFSCLGRLGATSDTVSALASILRHGKLKEKRFAAEAIACLGPPAASQEVLDILAEFLEGGPDELRTIAIAAIEGYASEDVYSWGIGEGLRSAAGSSRILRALETLTHCLTEEHRPSASRALRAISLQTKTHRGSAGTLEHGGLLSLLDLMPGGEVWEIERRVKQLWNGSDAGGRSNILTQLGQLLHDGDAERQRFASWGVKSIGRAAATPTILGAIPAQLRHEDKRNRYSAEQVIENFGPIAGTREIKAAVLELLQSDDEDERWSAARAMRGLRAAMATTEVVEVLHAQMRSGDKKRIRAACYALGCLGKDGANAETLECVTRLVCSEDDALVSAAFEAIGAIYKTPNSSSTHDESLGLGAEAGTPEILNALAGRICYGWDLRTQDVRSGREDAGVLAKREEALRVVRRIGGPAGTTTMLANLARLLRQATDQDGGYGNAESVTLHAISAVADIGASAVTPEVVFAIAGLIEKREGGWIQECIEETIDRLGAAAGSPEFVSNLARIFISKVKTYRAGAILDSLGRAGCRFFGSFADPNWRVRTVKDLSCLG